MQDTTSATSVTPAATLAVESRRAFDILRLGFTVAPILFGLDKFFEVMTEWVDYLPGFVTDAVSGTTVMAVVGVIEIAAGIGVWLRPRIFAPVVAAWLGLIVVTLILAGGYLDVALRDSGWRSARSPCGGSPWPTTDHPPARATTPPHRRRHGPPAPVRRCTRANVDRSAVVQCLGGPPRRHRRPRPGDRGVFADRLRHNR